VRGWAQRLLLISDSIELSGTESGDVVSFDRSRTAWFAAGSRDAPSLDGLIDRNPVAELLRWLHLARKGEPAWPPLAMFQGADADGLG